MEIAKHRGWRKRNDDRKKSMNVNARKLQKKKKTPTILSTRNTDVVCPACNMSYEDPLTEDWIQCHQCNEWWPDSCSSYEGHGQFTCDLCLSRNWQSAN